MAEKFCSTCESKVQAHWKYCRFCGQVLEQTKEDQVPEEKLSEKEVLDTAKAPEIASFDRELYYKVLSSRSNRSNLAKSKLKLSDEIKSLLIQVQSGLVSREYALPKIKELKSSVSEVAEAEKKYVDIPLELPVEVLLDEISSAKTKLKKIEKLKIEDGISKESIAEAKKRSNEAYDMLKDHHSRIAGDLRNWQHDLKNDLADSRKEFEQLTIRFKIGELTEETFIERKEGMVQKIEELDSTIEMIQALL